jgi:hypothetical protein
MSRQQRGNSINVTSMSLWAVAFREISIADEGRRECRPVRFSLTAVPLAGEIAS